MEGEPVSHRATPYPESPATLIVPDHVWRLTLEEIGRYRAHNSEALVFWGGVVLNRTAIVTGLFLPTHSSQGACVALTPEEARWLLRRLRNRDEKLLAQVHSHPGDAHHSTGDDRRAASYHPGYYSIVVPDYGRGVTSIEQCTVHLYGGQDFSPLPNSVASTLIQVTPTIERPRPVPIKAFIPTPRPRPGWYRWIASKLKQRPIAARRP